MSIYRQESHAVRYDEEKFGGAFGRTLREREVGAYLAWVPAAAGSVLDVGAGTGKLALPLAARGHAVTALDASEAMLQVARCEAERRGITLQTIVADAHALPFEDHGFDWVVCSRLLMHLDDWRAGIGELCRVARHGVVLDFQPRGSVSGLHAWGKRLRRRFDPGAHAFGAYAVRRVLHAFQEQGFEVMQVQRGWVLPLVFHRWLNRPAVSGRLERALRSLGFSRVLGAPVILQAMRGIPMNDGRLDEAVSKRGNRAP